MKTMIVVPCMDQVPTQFCQSLAMLDKSDCYIAFQMGSLIYMARNELAMKAIQFEADYILWLDSDMVFEPDTLKKLMKTMEEESADIVSGLYFRRSIPYKPVFYDRFEIVDDKPEKTEMDVIPDKPFEVGGVGFGCVLMKTSVCFDVMDKFGTLFAPIMNVGEDIAFCWRARQCGYKIILDPRIECGHVGHYVVTKDLWEAVKR